MKGFMTFVLGAAVGAATPTTGDELRERIKLILQKKGIIAADDVDELVEMIASEVEEAKK